MVTNQEPTTGTQPAAKGGPPTSAVRLATCDAETRDGRCGRVAWRVYTDTEGIERGFCWLAEHAWTTVEKYPAQEGSEGKVVAR